MGRRMDGAGAAAPLPPLRHFRSRPRTAGGAARRALVSAVALRAMARRQYTEVSSGTEVNPVVAARSIQARIAGPREPDAAPSHYRDVSGRTQRCAGKSATITTVTT